MRIYRQQIFSLLLGSAIIFWPNQIRSQTEECALSKYEKHLAETFPDYYYKKEQAEQFYVRNINRAASERSNEVLIIPVVVHLIQESNFETVTDNEVVTAIEYLNQAFSNQQF